MKHYSDEELIDYLHSELRDAQDARVHAHLAECADCQARCDAEARLGEALRGCVLAQEHEFPSAIKAHVWATIRAAQPTLLERIRAAVSPLAAVPLALGAALLLYLGVPILRSANAPVAPSVSALYYLEEHAAEGQENPLADRLTTNSTLAAQPAATLATIPLVEAADAATLDDVVAARR